MTLRSWLSRILATSPLAHVPVKVRKGPAKGARWTLLPFSSNWRQGGEGDLAPGLAKIPSLRGAVCWDFGAHFGIHTVGMAMGVGPTGQVASFEPDPVAFSRLECHVRANRLANVVLFRAAVSCSTGNGTMIAANGLGSTFSHLRYPDEPEPVVSDTVQVETVEPDALVARGRLRCPDLIKVDVQGHGSQALEGSIESIRATRPVIIFSSHSPWELGGSRALLEPLGYTVESLLGNSISWEALATETGILTARAEATPR